LIFLNKKDGCLDDDTVKKSANGINGSAIPAKSGMLSQPSAGKPGTSIKSSNGSPQSYKPLTGSKNSGIKANGREQSKLASSKGSSAFSASAISNFSSTKTLTSG